MPFIRILRLHTIRRNLNNAHVSLHSHSPKLILIKTIREAFLNFLWLGTRCHIPILGFFAKQKIANASANNIGLKPMLLQFPYYIFYFLWNFHCVVLYVTLCSDSCKF